MPRFKNSLRPLFALLDHVAYDSYGNVTAESSPASGDRFKFDAMAQDAAIGLYYDNARYYDSDAGRFVSDDPSGFVGGDEDLYGFVANSPTTLADTSGLQAAGVGISVTLPKKWRPLRRTDIDYTFIHVDPTGLGNSGINVGADIYLKPGKPIVIAPAIQGSEQINGPPNPFRPNPTGANPNPQPNPTVPDPWVHDPFDKYLKPWRGQRKAIRFTDPG